MTELICEYPDRLLTPDSTRFAVRVYGEPRPDGTWVGWLTFTALSSADVLRTERETTTGQ